MEVYSHTEEISRSRYIVSVCITAFLVLVGLLFCYLANATGIHTGYVIGLLTGGFGLLQEFAFPLALTVTVNDEEIIWSLKYLLSQWPFRIALDDIASVECVSNVNPLSGRGVQTSFYSITYKAQGLGFSGTDYIKILKKDGVVQLLSTDDSQNMLQNIQARIADRHTVDELPQQVPSDTPKQVVQMMALVIVGIVFLMFIVWIGLK